MRKNASEDLDAAIVRYTPYLSEVRKRLLFIVSIFLIAWTVGFIYYRQIVLFIMNLFDLQGINIAFTSPFEFISLAFNAGLLLGVSFTLPFILFQFFSFFKPALRTNEYRLILSFFPLNIILFVIGFGFGVFMMRFVISIFAQRTAELQIENLWDINLFLTQIVFTALLLGLFFQLPVILSILLKLGALKYSGLTKKRPYIYAVGLIFVVLLPPTDLFSLVAMYLPLVAMFELTLLFNRNIAKVQE